MRDERVFVDPEEFRPDRFSTLSSRSTLSSSDELTASEDSDDKAGADVDPASLSAHDPSDVVFGFGRRCAPSHTPRIVQVLMHNLESVQAVTLRSICSG